MNIKHRAKVPLVSLFLFFIYCVSIFSYANVSAESELVDLSTQHSLAEEPNISNVVSWITKIDVEYIDLTHDLNAASYDPALILQQYADAKHVYRAALPLIDKAKKLEKFSFSTFFSLKYKLVSQKESLSAQIKILDLEMKRLDEWSSLWREYNHELTVWHTFLLKKHSFSLLVDSLNRASSTIDKAQNKILERIEVLVALQIKGAEIVLSLDRLEKEFNLMAANNTAELSISSPPMYTSEYFQQYTLDLFYVFINEAYSISWRDGALYSQHKVAFSLLFFIFFILVNVIYKNKEKLKASEYWGVIADKPLATPLFVCSILMAIHFNFLGVVSINSLINISIGCFTCARLLGGILTNSRLRQVMYSVFLCYALTLMLISIGLPVAYYRLYTFIAVALYLTFITLWLKDEVKKSQEQKNRTVIMSLIVTAILLLVILTCEVFGNDSVSRILFFGLIKSASIVLSLVLLIYLLRGVLHWLFHHSFLWEIKSMRNDAEQYAKKFGVFLESVIIILVMLPAVFATWRGDVNLFQASASMLSLGFTLSGVEINVGLCLTVLMTLYLSLVLSKIIPQFFLDERITGRTMERGVKISVSRLIQYCIVFMGFIAALTLIGFDMTKFTIIISAFGVGIGFGLKGIVNNFVSGLILLAERPLRIGDIVEVDGQWAEIKSLGLRATVVTTYDQADLIIPNADLINNPVINWTLTNRQIRLSIDVGVAYGSDVSLVKSILADIAKECEFVVKTPQPQALLLNLGESSYDFKLRVWIEDADDIIITKSQLYSDVIRRFSEADIEIPFPQRVLHLPSAEEKL